MQNKDEFLNIIKLRIDDKASKNKRLEYLKKKIESKKATFTDTAEYSEIISNITGSTFSSFVSKMKSTGIKGYVCEELLKSRYLDMNKIMSEVQKSLDEKTGINIAPQQADFPIDRVRKVASSLEDTTVSQDVIERRADSAVSNVSKSFHDDYIQENAEFRSDAGIKCTITRTALGKCCAWCDAVCGTYVYGEEPEGIYRRHDNCSCEVIFENGRTAQDVWSKKTWEKPSRSNDYEPTSLSTEQAKALQDKNMPKSVANSAESGIIEPKENKILSSQQVIERAEHFLMNSKYETVESLQDVRKVTNSILGYDILPEVLPSDEFKQFAKKDNLLFRGIKPNAGKTADDIINELKYGKLWTGNTGGAIYGNGIYFTKTETTAFEYAENKNKVIKAVLKKDAKVANFNDIADEFLRVKKDISNEDVSLILGDYGQYAALKGYDAISTNNTFGANHDYIIVLNRGKLIVEE